MLLRAEMRGTVNGKPVMEGIIEDSADLDGMEKDGYVMLNGSKVHTAQGSLMFCVADNSVWVKGSDGNWSSI